VFSTVAAIAVWLSLALGGARASTASNEFKLHPVAADALSASLPAIRQVAIESSTRVHTRHRTPSIGFGIDRSVYTPLAAVPRARARSVGSAPEHVPPRRLALRYDATAPPAVL